MSPVAGVDGGGSGTRALILDEGGAELGSGIGPPGLVVSGRSERAASAVEEAVRAAAGKAGVSLPLAGLWCGLAGAGRADASAAVEEVLAGRGLAARVRVGTDVDAAFRDAFGPEDPGVLLVAGTGSIALGRSSRGGRIRVGGWGPLLGDEGSAYRIGLEGLRAVLRARDGRGPETELAALLTDVAEAGADPREIVSFADRAGKSGIGALAPTVLRAAEAGDDEARRIRDEATAELVEAAEAVLRRTGADGGTVEVVLAGGLLGPDGPLGDRVADELRERGRRVDRRPVRPERGAARLALEVAAPETG